MVHPSQIERLRAIDQEITRLRAEVLGLRDQISRAAPIDVAYLQQQIDDAEERAHGCEARAILLRGEMPAARFAS